jgi:hypothetical protein
MGNYYIKQMELNLQEEEDDPDDLLVYWWYNPKIFYNILFLHPTQTLDNSMSNIK